MTAKVVAAVVNLLLYNRNTLYTYNFYSYIFDRCYQLLPLLSTVVSIIAGWPHDSMTAATAELGLEVSEDEGEEEDEDEVEDKVEEFFA